METKELIGALGRLEAFLEPLLPQGLLLEGVRKTAAGIARWLHADEQALQQFINQSPWDWMRVRSKLARQMVQFVSPACAWVVDDTGFPRKGKHSVGVARQYSGTLGKVGNCQLAVSLNYATDEACFPLDFSLYLPEDWIDDTERRWEAKVPEDRKFMRKWQLALEMMDHAREWGIPEGVVVADAGYGVATPFRVQLRKRGLTYVLGIQGDTGFWLKEVKITPPAYQGRGRSYSLPSPEKAAAIARELPEPSWQEVVWREGSKGPLKSRFAAVRAQPSHGHAHGQVIEPMGWLLVEWPEESEQPTKFWVSNLPQDTSLRDLVYRAKTRWWVEQNYQQLKDHLGLDHFEGRSWNGWHHHVTLTMMAFGFLTLETIRLKKTSGWTIPRVRREIVQKILLFQLGFCPLCERKIYFRQKIPCTLRSSTR